MSRMSGRVQRVQGSLFLPEPVAAAVQAIRAEFDPYSAGVIRPHITVLYENELSQSGSWTDDLSNWVSTRSSFRVELSKPRLWSDQPADGIYLGVADVEKGISSLRNHFVTKGAFHQSDLDYVPHVTLCHARRVDPTLAIRAWNYLEALGSFGGCTIDRMSLIRTSYGIWREVAHFEFRRLEGD
jgi:2'-5' RNA ligase